MKIQTIKQVNIDAFKDQVNQSTIEFMRGAEDNQHYLLKTTIQIYLGDPIISFVNVDELREVINEDGEIKENLKDLGKNEEEAQQIITDIQTIIYKCDVLEIDKIIL